MLKICTCCKQEKPITDFSLGAGYKDGIRSSCKVCRAKYSKQRHKLTYTKKTEAELAEAKKIAKQKLHLKKEQQKKDKLQQKMQKHEKWLLGAEERRLKKKAQNAAYRKKYKQQHPTKRKIERLNRKNKVKTSGSLSSGIVKKLLASQNNLCVYCKTDITHSRHIDHIYPISKGGTNTDDNVQLLCPNCNLEKSDKDPDVFAYEVLNRYTTKT